MNRFRQGVGRCRSLSIEALESRMMLSVAEPNNTPATAVVVPDVYLEQQYFATDAVHYANDQEDYFRFYTLNGPSRLYAALYNLSADADLFVYKGSAGTQEIARSVRTGAQSELIEVDLAAGEYYYVRVLAFGVAITDYSLLLLNDYAGPTLGTARDVGAAWGQSNSKYWDYGNAFYNDYMDFRDNVDYVKFEMEAPGTISARRLATFGPTPLATSMELLDANGNVLTNGASDAGGLDIDGYGVPAGTYYMRFTQSAGAGDYQYRIVSDYAGGTTASAREIGNLTGSTRQMYDMVGDDSGQLPSYDDAVDMYRFTFDQTAPLDAQLTTFGEPTFDASLRLAQDTNGNGLISAGEVLMTSANAGADRITTTLAAGVYYVLVDQNGPYTSYRLDFDSDFDTVPFSPNPWADISNARPVGVLPGEVNIADGFGYNSVPRDFFRFQMEAAGTLTIRAFLDAEHSRAIGQGSITTIVRDDNQNQLWDAGEELLPIGQDSYLALGLPAGVYYLVTSGTGEQIAYELEFTPDYAGDVLPAARLMAAIGGATPPPQPFFDRIEGELGFGDDVDDFYRFTLPAAYQVTLSMTSIAGEDVSLALIQDANLNGVVEAGETLQTSNTLNSPVESITRSLAVGTYYVRVHGINGFFNYILTMSAVQSGASSADFDGDGDVDGADFLRWQRGLGATGAAATRANGNADNDNDVDGADLTQWRNTFGSGAIAAVSPLVTAPVAVAASDGPIHGISAADADLSSLAMTVDQASASVFRPTRSREQVVVKDAALAGWRADRPWRPAAAHPSAEPVRSLQASHRIREWDARGLWNSSPEEPAELAALEAAFGESLWS